MPYYFLQIIAKFLLKSELKSVVESRPNIIQIEIIIAFQNLQI